jgi:hypothetical protein
LRIIHTHEGFDLGPETVIEYRLRRFPQNYQGSAIADENVGFKFNKNSKYVCSFQNLIT